MIPAGCEFILNRNDALQLQGLRCTMEMVHALQGLYAYGGSIGPIF